jgi:hypothetical protein
MDENDILSRIHSLVDEEHKLRGTTEHTEEQRSRIGKLEADLDQCWDLLRQRRARREFGENPDEAMARPVGEVEGYQQ